MNKGKCVQRGKRTTHKQLEEFLKFVEENPQILANKNNPNNPDGVKKLWGELTNKLNALNGPVRTSMEWKHVLTHWKNQLRSRARKNKFMRSITGGGPPVDQILNKFEERALGAFGKIVISGDEDVQHLGFEVNENAAFDLLDDSTESIQIESSVVDPPTMMTPLSSSNSSTPSASTPASLSSSSFSSILTETKSSVWTKKIVEQISEISDRREKNSEIFQNEMLKSQNCMIETLDKVAASQEKMADSFCKIGEAITFIGKVFEKISEK